jgi:hypothetical protein
MAGLIRKGSKRVGRSAEEDDDGAPLMATSAAFDAPTQPIRRARKNGGEGRGHAGLVTSKTGTINLKSVAQACMDAGLDPAVEIARVLAEKVPARSRSGEIMMGEDGKPIMVDLIDPDTKIRTLTELLQYNQPKLKAVEMTVKTDLSEDEIDQRLTALLAKAVR